MQLDGIRVLSNLPALDALAELAAYVEPPACIVEIGTYQGGSLARMAAATTAHCYGIDPWERLPIYADHAGRAKQFGPANQAVAQQHLETMGVADRATLIRAYSVAAAADWTGPTIGMLYIDGDHDHDAVLDDFNAWRPLLTSNAIVAFDDYDHRRMRFAGLIRAVDHLAATNSIAPIRVAGNRLAISHVQPARTHGSTMQSTSNA